MDNKTFMSNHFSTFIYVETIHFKLNQQKNSDETTTVHRTFLLRIYI